MMNLNNFILQSWCSKRQRGLSIVTDGGLRYLVLILHHSFECLFTSWLETSAIKSCNFGHKQSNALGESPMDLTSNMPY
jgi:hypothetical protein